MQAIDVVALEAHGSDWVRAHEALSRLAKERAMADAEEGRRLLAALRSAVHVHLGFGSFGEYIERLFGYGRRCTQEKLRVAEALEQLPALARALDEGALRWSAVRDVTRVAVSETERAWLEVAYGKTILGGPSDDGRASYQIALTVCAECGAASQEANGELVQVGPDRGDGGL